jgi:tRNA-uridine 2-sulfurtransferase
MARKKAVVAMSGGVDSSVSAALLVESGYDVTGIMLKLWRGGTENTDSGCCSVGAADDARRVADRLGIPFYVFNFAERFEDTVISDFHRTYAAGRTPNPCVRCNQWIKFDLLLERARGLGADVLATGHYARVDKAGDRYRLLRGADAAKDQSYVLWMLTQEELGSVRFPVGHLEKTETRHIAAELGLRTATKPDSQEICFVRDGDVGSYVREHVASKPGELVDVEGKDLGEHAGVGHYTIGQRKGLGISLGVPVYVTDIDVETNRVVVGSRSDLVVSGLKLEEVSFVTRAPVEGTRVWVQHRAHGEVAPARIESVAAGHVELAYESDVMAVAPGQSAALYSIDDPNELIGGGIIAATVKADSSRSTRASVA